MHDGRISLSRMPCHGCPYLEDVIRRQVFSHTLIPLISKLDPPESGEQHVCSSTTQHVFLKATFDTITNTDWPAQIDKSLLYDRPIRTSLSACPAPSLSQPIMASGKIAVFFCGLTNKARNFKTIIRIYRWHTSLLLRNESSQVRESILIKNIFHVQTALLWSRELRHMPSFLNRVTNVSWLFIADHSELETAGAAERVESSRSGTR